MWHHIVSDVMQTARLAHALTVVVIDDCTPSLNCSSELYACNSHNCVCDAVAEMVRKGVLELMAAPVHEESGQCFARFVPPLCTDLLAKWKGIKDAAEREAFGRRMSDEHYQRYFKQLKPPDVDFPIWTS